MGRTEELVGGDPAIKPGDCFDEFYDGATGEKKIWNPLARPYLQSSTEVIDVHLPNDPPSPRSC